MFDSEQIEFLRQLELDFDFDNLSDDDFAEIEESVSIKLQTDGFDNEYNITPIGEMCESILDKLAF